MGNAGFWPSTVGHYTGLPLRDPFKASFLLGPEGNVRTVARNGR